MTRDERRRRVIELHNQGYGTREIAEILQMSFRDIGPILRDADKEKEAEQQQTRQKFLSSQAYKLFSEGKSPVQVAIEMNIRASEAITLQREYWDLEHLDSLNEIYRELKHDIWYFVDLHKLAKASGMNPEHVAKLLVTANNDLPSVEYRYANLKVEVSQLEEQKHKLERKSVELDNELTEKSNYVGHYQAACGQEASKLNALRRKRMKFEAMMRDYENYNDTYIKIRNIIEEMARSTLSNPKILLRYAILSLVETMRKNPNRYRSLIYNCAYSPIPARTGYAGDNIDATDIYGHYQQNSSTAYFSEGCIDMIIEELEEIYNKLVKEWTDSTIDDYAHKVSSLPSPPPPSEEE